MNSLTSATSASLISSPVSGSSTAPGYCTGVQAWSGMVPIALLTVEFLTRTRENRAQAARQAATTTLLP